MSRRRLRALGLAAAAAAGLLLILGAADGDSQQRDPAARKAAAAAAQAGARRPGAPASGLLASPQMPGAFDRRSASDPWAELRHNMVEQQIRRRREISPRVLAAMQEVPRHLFVPEEQRSSAYVDGPLPIGAGQTISQPYIVALMTDLLGVDSDDKVLEIGTGSGYQAAVLSRIVKQVYSIEIRESLAETAGRTLAELGYDNVKLRVGDGYQGWREEAPFDGIIVTAAPKKVPEPLREQLKVGGRLVIPVGGFFQGLLVITRTEDGYEQREESEVRFVPMIGEVEKQP